MFFTPPPRGLWHAFLTLSLVLFCVKPVAAAEEEAQAAVEQPAPWTYYRNAVGIAYGPLGLIADTRIQRRVALSSIGLDCFSNTFAAAGGRFRASPAFLDGGLLPIDFAHRHLRHGCQRRPDRTWPGLSLGKSYTTVSATKGRTRRAKNEEQQPGMRLLRQPRPPLN